MLMSKDAVPFSECRNNLSTYIGRVRKPHRPILITQNGHAASCLVDCESMDALFDQLDDLPNLGTVIPLVYFHTVPVNANRLRQIICKPYRHCTSLHSRALPPRGETP